MWASERPHPLHSFTPISTSITEKALATVVKCRTADFKSNWEINTAYKSNTLNIY